MSNSIEANLQIKSLSPKSISNNITISNDKKRNQGQINKITFNKISTVSNNNQKKQSNVNKINIPLRQNKNSINYSNSNYNINFNNLIFYSPNTPSSFIADIKYNLMNSHHSNNNVVNQNVNKINTNFYMLNLNNLYSSNSRNKIKLNTNNSSSINKVKSINTNSQSKNLPKNENSNIKKKKINLKEKKIALNENRQLLNKVKKTLGSNIIKEKEKLNKIKMENINCINNCNGKRKNSKSLNNSDVEKNRYDKIENKKLSLIKLKGMISN
jgi:hypothetical protein